MFQKLSLVRQPHVAADTCSGGLQTEAVQGCPADGLKCSHDAESVGNRAQYPTDCLKSEPRFSTRQAKDISGLRNDPIAQVVDDLIADERFLSSLVTALEGRGFGGPLLEDDVLVPLDVAKQISGLGKTMIYALVRQGKFPPPYKPGGVATRWSLCELREWKRGLKHVRHDG